MYSEENNTTCITLTNTTKCLNFIEESKVQLHTNLPKFSVTYKFAQFSITCFPQKFLEVVGIRWLCISQQVNNITVWYVVKNTCLVTEAGEDWKPGIVNCFWTLQQNTLPDTVAQPVGIAKLWLELQRTFFINCFNFPSRLCHNNLLLKILCH